MIAGSQTIAGDRRRSQTIAEVCFHMIADDRRTFCDLRSYGNQPLAGTGVDFTQTYAFAKNVSIALSLTIFFDFSIFSIVLSSAKN